MLHPCELPIDRSSSDALITLASQSLMTIAGATCVPPPKTNSPPGGHHSGPGGVGIAGAPATMDSIC